MSEVKRWSIVPYDQYSVDERTSRNGEWVKWEDYEALTAERDRLAAQLAEARAEGFRQGIEAAATLASDAASGLCQRCGHPRDNHPYRHPFIGFQPDNLSAAIRALPMPDGLGGGNG